MGEISLSSACVHLYHDANTYLQRDRGQIERSMVGRSIKGELGELNLISDLNSELLVEIINFQLIIPNYTPTIKLKIVKNTI